MKEIYTNLIEDENLKPRYWWNKSNQTHVFISKLKSFYPNAKEELERYYAHPGKVTLLPHNYWIIDTRDSSPAVGQWVHGKEIEAFSLKSLAHADKSV